MLQIKNTLGGSKPEGLYVWKKYEYVETPNPYLSFIGNEDFTLKTKNTTANWNGTLEYSTDTTTWKTWNGSEISSANGLLYLRGIGNTVITANSHSAGDYRFVFTGTDSLKVSCEGNIENLLDYNKVLAGEHPTMNYGCFRSLFQGQTTLVSAPELLATTVIEYCYTDMFYGCSSLITPPSILPATTLTNYCYQQMFYNCTSLTTVPELPATTLADYCYSNMFYGCTSLTTPPELPATTLANYCYYSMFYNCTSLTTVPNLPATTLAYYCYANMFYNCRSLTSIPKLRATKLYDHCYYSMFFACVKIKISATKTGEYETAYRIPTSGTGATATSALEMMFTNSGGTFADTPSINTTYYLSTSNTIV